MPINNILFCDLTFISAMKSDDFTREFILLTLFGDENYLCKNKKSTDGTEKQSTRHIMFLQCSLFCNVFFVLLSERIVFIQNQVESRMHNNFNLVKF